MKVNIAFKSLRVGPCGWSFLTQQTNFRMHKGQEISWPAWRQ